LQMRALCLESVIFWIKIKILTLKLETLILETFLTGLTSASQYGTANGIAYTQFGNDQLQWKEVKNWFWCRFRSI
jgi:hypothetical protein